MKPEQFDEYQNRVGFFQKDWTLGSDGHWHTIAAFLVVEMEEKINLGMMFVTPSNPNPNRVQQRVMRVSLTMSQYVLQESSTPSKSRTESLDWWCCRIIRELALRGGS
jgi:hypothetical protein